MQGAEEGEVDEAFVRHPSYPLHVVWVCGVIRIMSAFDACGNQRFWTLGVCFEKKKRFAVCVCAFSEQICSLCVRF